jgi:hypothetical protein
MADNFHVPAPSRNFLYDSLSYCCHGLAQGLGLSGARACSLIFLHEFF